MYTFYNRYRTYNQRLVILYKSRPRLALLQFSFIAQQPNNGQSLYTLGDYCVTFIKALGNRKHA